MTFVPREGEILSFMMARFINIEIDQSTRCELWGDGGHWGSNQETHV